MRISADSKLSFYLCPNENVLTVRGAHEMIVRRVPNATKEDLVKTKEFYKALVLCSNSKCRRMVKAEQKMKWIRACVYCV